jgi:anti-anti-sigma factor
MTSKLTVRVKDRNDFAVLYTEGYINHVGGEEIAHQFEILYEKGFRKYIFNLAGSSIINSIGISILIEIIEKLVADNGSLYFCHLTPVISRTFEIMGLTQYSKIFDTEDEAVNELIKS